MKYRFSVLSLLILPFLGRGQGFELFLGDPAPNINDVGANVIQLPNEDAYLVIRLNYAEQDISDLGYTISKVGQLGNLLWEKSFSNQFNSVFAVAYDALPTGFLLGFTTFSGLNSYIYIKEFNFEGELVNESSYQFAGYSQFTNMVALPDHSFVCIGHNSLSQAILLRLSQNGSLIWTKYYPSSTFSTNSYKTLASTPAGEILILRDIDTIGPEKAMMKFDQNGDLVWQTSLPIESENQCNLMALPEGDGYFVWGENISLLASPSFIIKISDDGQLVWNHNFSSHINSFTDNGVLQGEGNTLYLTGVKYDGNFIRNTALVQIDGDGNVLWEKRYHEFDLISPGQLVRGSDGGFFIAVQTSAFAAQGFFSDPYLLKTNAAGELLWSWYAVNSDSYDHVEAIPTSDGGYLVAGNSEWNYNQGYQVYLIKLDSNGNVYTNYIAGQLAFDENLSCTFNNNEPTLAGWKVKAVGFQNTYTTTLPDGTFLLPTNGDSVAVSVILPNTECWDACPNSAIVLFDAPFDTTTVDLFAQAIKNCPLLEIDASTPFLRRCFENNYTIQCKNNGTVAAENTQIKVFLDPSFEYVSASAPLFSQNGNEYNFGIGTLAIGETYTLTLQVEISCDAELGQVHCLSVRAFADNTCSDVDNTLAQTRECQPNIGSFDPNDKRAFSLGTLTDRFIPADSIIEYHIRFQNTGTDTAFNIVVTDTLSNLLNIESIIAGSASHPYRMELEQNDIVRFIFNDIMLPDSNVNEAASHGFVKFRIRHRPGLVPGDVIPNKAAIYFDFNEAVITNELELEIQSPPSIVNPTREGADLLKIYPQPASGVVYFELKNNGTQHPTSLEVFNLLGQRIHSQPIKEGVNAVAHLPAGQHFYRLRQNGAVVQAGKVLVVD